jgi:thiol-disulfide isomerase/thioredoxin
MPFLLITGYFLLASFGHAGPGPLHGGAAAAELDTFRRTVATSNPRPSPADYAAKVKAKANELLAGVDLDRLAPSEGADWGRVLTAAERYQDSYLAIEKYLSSKPTPADAFKALNTEFQDALNGDIRDHGRQVKPLDVVLRLSPPTDREANFAAYELSEAANKIDPSKNRKEALAILDTGSKFLRNYPGAQARVVAQKAEILVDAGLTAEAKKTVLAALKGKNLASPDLRSLVTLKNRLSLEGSTAPEFTFTRKYGEFTSLSSLKGKVVILDFFAHWCPPCKASFPDFRKLTDDLASNVAAVGVTSYYGFFDKEQNLSQADEFARMSGFLEKYRIDHPVIYVEKTEFDKYGVPGIPQFVLIDKQGKVKAVQVGYDAPSFAEFRKKVEAAVKE